MRTITILSLLLLILTTGEAEPQDWFNDRGTPTFECTNVGENVTSYSWFQVLYGFMVFPVASHSSNLTISKDYDFDRDFFCEAKSRDGRVWRSRKAQLRYELKSPASPPAPLAIGPLDTPRMQRPLDGDSCHLTCSFPETSKAAWIHNGKPVGNNNNNPLLSTVHKQGESTLYIVRFDSSRHSGVYQCLVSSTSDRWQPLRKPYLFSPPSNQEVLPDLPFFHYEIVTVGELAMNEDNEHAPVITSTKGTAFAVSVNDSVSGSNVMTLTSVVVTDLDRGRAGQLNCSVTNSSGNGFSLKFIKVSSINTSQLIGKLVLAASPWPEKPIRFDLKCSDRGKRKKTTTESFKVTLKRGQVASSEESRTTRRLVALATESLQNKPTNETLLFVKKLSEVTKDVGQFSAVDISLTSAKTAEVIEVMDQMNRSKDERNEMLSDVTNIISNTLKVKPEILSSGEDSSSVASLTLSSVGRLLSAVPDDDGPRVIKSEQLAVGAVGLDASSKENSSEIAFSSESGRPEEAQVSNVTSGKVAISLRAAHVVGERVEFALFDDAALFEAMAQNRTTVLSPVISARAVLKRWEEQDPVRLFFNGDNLEGLEEDAGRFCAFWNETLRSWDKAGCDTKVSGRVTECSCSHLTNFALLLDLDAKPVRRHDQLALSFLSYLCLTLSCAALALTIFVYFTYMRRKQASSRSGQKSGASAVTRSRVLLALSGSLLVAHFLFLVTAFHSSAGRMCKAIALMLHFFYLSVFLWSVVEGLNVFLSLIYMALNSGRIVTHLSNFFPKAAATVWGLSTLVVIVTAASTRLAGYGPLSEGKFDVSLCFLSGRLSFMFSFVMPLALCLCANLVILALLAFVLMRRAGGMSAKQKSRSKNKVIGFLSVCVTLNMTWAIGLLQFGPGKAVMNYLFVIGNGLQGVLIFVFYCLLREEMRSHIAKTIWCLSWMRPVGEDSGTSTGVPLTSTSSGRKTSVTSLVSRRKKSSVALPSKVDEEWKRNH